MTLPSPRALPSLHNFKLLGGMYPPNLPTYYSVWEKFWQQALWVRYIAIYLILTITNLFFNLVFYLVY